MLEYTGSKADRQIIRKHEFHYADAKTKALKFDVLLVCFPFHLLLTVTSLCVEHLWHRERAAGAGIILLEIVYECVEVCELSLCWGCRRHTRRC